MSTATGTQHCEFGICDGSGFVVDELTQTEIATRIGVSQMQVSRMLRRSLERLRAVADAA